jgi:DNA-binding transcriptional ArsR family regulator
MPYSGIIGHGDRVILAHLAGIPVEEWAPFWVPIVVLLVWGWRRERRGRAAIAKLPKEQDLLTDATFARIHAAWRAAGLDGAEQRHLKLLYPPGPDGLTVAQLAEQTKLDERAAARQLLELEEAGFVTLDGKPGPEQQVFLTMRGFDLESVTEEELLRAADERAAPEPVAGVSAT